MTGVYVIAEAGVNHNGDPDQAVALVDAAADAGADAVKFQTFRAEALATATAALADYQQARTGATGGQLAMLRALELSPDTHRRLVAYARSRNIAFLSTPFDIESLRFLVDGLGLDTIKLGSGEVANGPLLVAAGRTGRNVILSTGMSTLDDVADALGALVFGYREPAGRPAPGAFRTQLDNGAVPADLAGKITLLHCTTAYPAPAADANLRAMKTMATRFGVPVGLSDHTEGWTVAVAAVARGAAVIEKHLTLDRALPGPDQAASLEPDAFAAMVRAIREVEAALGDGVKRAMPSEISNIEAARKSLVALAPVRRGMAFDETTLGVKRPGGGVSPMEYWRWLGRTATRDYAADELIEAEE